METCATSRATLGAWLALLLAAMLGWTGCSTTPTPKTPPAPTTTQTAVRKVLDDQAAAWSAGRLDDFMQGYAASPTTRFASAGDVHLGWQTVYDRYRRRYGEGASMGQLKFTDLDIQELGPDAALAFGRYHLDRGGEHFTGLFTLVFRRTPSGWKIVHDHTSAAETK